MKNYQDADTNVQTDKARIKNNKRGMNKIMKKQMISTEHH